MSDGPPPGRVRQIRLLLLRHGEVASHRGDVPVTDDGLETARQVGRRLGADNGWIQVLSGATLRTRQTAEAVALGANEAGAGVDGPRESFALRNPDLYLAGERVDMVSNASAFAAQVPTLRETDVTRSPFYAGFIAASDRIAWWLRHSSPPGDGAATVHARLQAFAESLLDLGPNAAGLVVGITHSPLIRAYALAELGHDPGEPPWVSGVEISIRAGHPVQAHWTGALYDHSQL